MANTGLTTVGNMYRWFFGGAMSLIITMAIGFHWSTQNKLDSIIAIQNEQAVSIARNEGSIGGLRENQEKILSYIESIGETLTQVTTTMAVLQANQISLANEQ